MLTKTEQNIGAVISMFSIALLSTYIGLSIFGLEDETAILITMGIVFLLSVVLCLLVVRKYRKSNNPGMIDYLNVGTQRYILALFMILYGIDKLLGNFFDYQLFALDSKLADVSEFQLTWFFYGKNIWQELFAGIMEFVPGIFLFGRRTYYIAALILLPVTAQVFLLNFFFKIGGITFPAATVLLCCNLYIIYSQKQKIMLFFRSLNFNITEPLTGTTKRLIRVLKRIALILAALIIFAKVKPALFETPLQKKYQELVGVYTLKEMKKNGSAYKPVNDSVYYKDLYIEKQSRWNILRRFNGETDAFILRMNPKSDSVDLYINNGGIGDDPDIIDTSTTLKGIYKLQGKYLTLKGIQSKDTLELVYEKQDRIQPKKWFW